MHRPVLVYLVAYIAFHSNIVAAAITAGSLIANYVLGFFSD